MVTAPRTRRLIVASMLALGLLAAGCGGSDGTPPGASIEAGTAPPGGEPAGPAGDDGAESGARASGELLDLQVPVSGPRVVKTATLAVEVRDGSFDRRFQEAVVTAGRHGGFVASSHTAGRDRRSGTLVLRVPAEQFEVALGELKALGEVRSEQVSGEDVTARFVDLEARLRNWEAQELVLLGLMEEANTIDESIRVQRTLQDVQLAIEQIRGQLRVLEDQTAMSTITLALAEAGAPVVTADDDETPTLSEAWQLALRGAVAVVSTLVITLGYLVPLGLIALAGMAVYRRVRPRGRRVATA